MSITAPIIDARTTDAEKPVMPQYNISTITVMALRSLPGTI